MKKTLIFIITAAAVLAGCTREPLDSPKGIPSDHTCITLKPVVADLSTRATEAGDDTYHENVISGYYWFIYSDQAGTNLKVSGHETTNDEKEILLDEYFPNGGTAYVYVVANLPEKPEGEGNAEWFEYVEATQSAPAGIKRVTRSGSDESSHTYAGTLSTLTTLEFGKDTPVVNNAIVAGQSEFYNYTSATTGLPAPEKFVMRTASPVSVSLQEKTNVPVTAELKRVAAKIILDLLVAQEVKQTYTNTAGQEEYKKTWIADVEHIQIYMLWGSTHGKLSGDTVTYSSDNQNWFYFASPRYAMYTNPDGGNYNASINAVEGSVVIPDGSLTEYPVSSSVWEVVYQVKDADGDGNPDWVWNSTVPEADRIPENEGNLSYGDWDYVLENGDKVPALDANGDIQRRLTTVTENKPYYSISSLPLYSMPISWNVNDAHAPFIKIILPWQGCIRDNQGEGDITSSDSKTTEFYYKILVPNRTTLDANGCYHISLDLSVLGSEADEVPVLLNGEYHVVGWNEPESFGGEVTAGRYLNCGTSFEFYSQDVMNIPVSSSHDIEIVGTPTATYQNYSQATVSSGSLQYSETSSTGNYFTVSTTGNNKFTVSHTLETDLDEMASRDVSPITYTVTIQHKGDGGSAYRKTITIVQYPPLYITREASNGNLFVNAYGRGNSATSAWDSRGAQTLGSTGYLDYFLGAVMQSNGTPSNTNNYDIHTSALEADSKYILMDPREDVFTDGSDLHLDGLTNYRMTRSDIADGIAPTYKVASFYGACVAVSSGFNSYGMINYDGAVKRCASYQENGYPAGRWRVPTEAEIEYAISLSLQGLIPVLFNSTYWASSGRAYSYTDKSFDDATQAVVRCVYDSWYWGDEKLANTATWGGFQTDYMN